jgi:hypothetical protein
MQNQKRNSEFSHNLQAKQSIKQQKEVKKKKE